MSNYLNKAPELKNVSFNKEYLSKFSNKTFDDIMISLLEHLPNGHFRNELSKVLEKKFQVYKINTILEMQELWFKTFSWFLAKLYMVSVIFMFAIFLMFGNLKFDLLASAIIGSSIYYLFVQLLGPYRLNKNKNELLNQISYINEESLNKN